MTIHILKLNARYYEDVRTKNKTFEVRYNDRGFKVGDRLILREIFDSGEYSGRLLQRKVSYMLTHEEFPQGLKEGYAVLALVNDCVFTGEEADELRREGAKIGIADMWRAIIDGRVKPNDL